MGERRSKEQVFRDAAPHFAALMEWRRQQESTSESRVAGGAPVRAVVSDDGRGNNERQSA